jgi:hypothetical protein
MLDEREAMSHPPSARAFNRQGVGARATRWRPANSSSSLLRGFRGGAAGHKPS